MIQRIRKTINHELNQLAYNLQRIDPIGVPEVYQIELTNHCPMTCNMCPRKNMTRELGYMEEPLFRRIIQEASEFSSRVFFHHFGDSLVHPRLGELVRYANQQGIQTFLSANPVLLTEQRSREIVDNGLCELVLSLDGLTGDTSAAIRGEAARDVDLAEKRILYLLEYRRSVGSKTPFVILQIVRQKKNIHEVEAWVKKWNKVDGLDQVKVKFYVIWDGQDENINSLKPEDASCSDTLGVVCDMPWTSVTILWDGRVVPCCFDYDGLYVLGNLNRQSLKEIWGGERIKHLRQCHRDGNLHEIRLCDKCIDFEGYSVRKWYYPLNRWFTKKTNIGDEWIIT